MGILDAYDKYGTPVITPDKVYDTKIRRADTCVVTFSHNVLEKVLDKFNHIVAGQIGSANGTTCRNRMSSSSCHRSVHPRRAASYRKCSTLGM